MRPCSVPSYPMQLKVDELRTHRRGDFYATVVIGAAALIIVLAPIIKHGVPLYQHDWIWPIVRPGFFQMAWFGLSSWSPQNLGGPNLYPTNAAAIVAESVFANVFAPRMGLILYLGCIVALMFSGMYLLLGELPAVPWLRLTGSVAYVLAPFVSVQLVAGHLDDLVAMAGLPFLVYALLSSRHTVLVRSAIGMCAAFLCIQQVQYLVLVPVVSLTMAVMRRTRDSFVVAGIVVVSLFALAGPTEFQLLSHVATSPLLTSEQTTVGWEQTQSVGFPQALLAKGYFAGYDQPALPAYWVLVDQVGFWLLILLFACGVIFQFASPMVRGATFLYAIGILTISGVKGPLATQWVAVFSQFRAASLFRELFHIAPLIGLPLVIGSIAGAKAITSMHGVKWKVGAVLLLCCGYFVWDVNALFLRTDRWFSGTAHISNNVIAAYNTLGDRQIGRFLIAPGRQPVKGSGAAGIGVDPLSYYPRSTNFAQFNYFPYGLSAYASDLLTHGEVSKAEYVMAHMSVGAKIFRLEPRAAYQDLSGGDAAEFMDRPHLSKPAPDVRARPLVWGATLPVAVSGGYERLEDPQFLRVPIVLLRGGPRAAGGFRQMIHEQPPGLDKQIGDGCGTIDPVRTGPLAMDPVAGWARSSRFGAYAPEVDSSMQSAVITSASGSPDYRTDKWALALKISKRGVEGSYRWRKLPRLLAKGTYFSVAGYFREVRPCVPSTPARESGHAEVLNVIRTSPWRVSGTVKVYGAAGALYFSDAYDKDWKLILVGRPGEPVPHFESDGFANGWVLRGGGAQKFVIEYARQQTFMLLTSIEFLTAASGAIIIFMGLLTMKRTDYPKRRVKSVASLWQRFQD